MSYDTSWGFLINSLANLFINKLF